MPRYINKDKALKLQYWAGEGRIRYGVVDADDIENMPEEDVAPVRHGKPEPRYEQYYNSDGNTVAKYKVGYKCPFCGDSGIRVYCPNCGAKMDLE